MPKILQTGRGYSVGPLSTDKHTVNVFSTVKRNDFTGAASAQS